MLQYEGAYVGLQSEPIELRGEACAIFFGQLCADGRAEDKGALAAELSLARVAAEAARDWQPVTPMRRAPDMGAPYASPALSRTETERLWPERRLEETAGGELYSFFTGHHTHVALAAKEAACRRPHGTILMSAQTPDALAENVLASTVYMPGVFASTTVIGNTSFHKGVSVARGYLNLQSHSGVRLYVRMEDEWRLLTMPAAFEMTVGGAVWHYLLGDGDRLTVNAFVRASEPDMTLSVRAVRRTYDSGSLPVGDGEQEWEHPILMTREGGSVTFGLPPEARASSPYPDWHMTATVFAREWTLGDDRVFFADGKARDETLTCVEVPASAGFAVQLHAALAREAFAPPLAPADPAAEAAAFERNLARMTGGLRMDGADPGLARLRELLPWYVHNASVHMASPHGLEQPGGAAWGTRDVCQGPFELLYAFGHYALARQVLLRVYAHQSARSGQWPQWFMFDRYPIAADNCHGDVFLWPLKCVADYLLETGDDAVLAEPLPYADRAEPETLLAHVGRAAALLSARRQPGRALLTYAGGDWDDTLQPADPAMAEKLVSSWTQALACQTAQRLSEALERPAPELAKSLRAQADALAKAFLTHLVRNGQIAGFLLRDGERDLPLLHPGDDRTGLRCRLLPLTRSIIAELVDANQAQRNVEQIDRYLACPDGVRLMDRPANYDGGEAKLFRRAEQAANVGREIGLMYVHAHVRYVEAMAKLGLAKRAWEGMLAVAPPLLNESVPNALPRQSNLYFSSSDGDFADRYAFAAGYDRLRAGTVGVLGGWRLYSSGPGICLRTLTECVFGVRRVENDVVIDPVLPAELTGCALGCTLFDRPWTLRYRRRRRRQRTGDLRRPRGAHRSPCQPLPARGRAHRAGDARGAARRYAGNPCGITPTRIKEKRPYEYHDAGH